MFSGLKIFEMRASKFDNIIILMYIYMHVLSFNLRLKINFFLPVQFVTGSVTDSESNDSSGLQAVPLITADGHPI